MHWLPPNRKAASEEEYSEDTEKLVPRTQGGFLANRADGANLKSALLDRSYKAPLTHRAGEVNGAKGRHLKKRTVDLPSKEKVRYR